MAVSVNMPSRAPVTPQREAPDPLDQLLKGLQIASSIYGIKHGIDQNDLAKLNAERQAEALKADTDYKQKQFDLAKAEGGYTLDEQGQLAIDPKSYKAQQLEIQRQAAKKSAESSALDTQAKALDVAKKSKEMMQEKKGKLLPASSAESFASSNASLQALEAANAAVQSSQAPTGPFLGRVSGAMGAMELGETGKAAKTLDAQLKLNAQTIGKYLEGGKLTDADIDRYKQMLPSLTDSPEAAQKKTQLLQTLISQKQQSELQTFGQSGYDVSNIQGYQPNIGAIRSSGQQSFGLPSAQAAQNDFSTQAQYILQQRAKSKGK